MKSFLEDVISDIGNLAEVKTFNGVYKKYKLVSFVNPINPMSKEWYLRTCCEPDNNKEFIHSNPELLISIINLATKIEENDGLKDQLAFTDEVTEWCVKYGFPFQDDYFWQNYYEDVNGNPKNKKDYVSRRGEMPLTGYLGFSVKEFKRRIAVLYSIFQLWYGLTFDDMKKIITFSPILSKIDIDKDLDTQILGLKEFLPYLMTSKMKTMISLQYNEKDDGYSIVPITDNLISVAYFQLAMIMTTKGFKGVKFCSHCNKLFKVNHGSTKMCDSCKRDYHRIKTQESRMRNERKR